MKELSIILIALLATLAFSTNAQDVYRVVDEHGNVTYTDQKPDDNAEPMKLPELNVLEGDAESLPGAEGDRPLAQGEAQPMNFRIEQPANGAALTPEGQGIWVVMGIDIEVPPTARITLVLDGRALTPVRTLEADIPAPPPGEHRLFARLETPSGRVLGTTDPVTFTMLAPGGD